MSLMNNSSTVLYPQNGRAVHSLELVMWLEHTTCWLRISCSTDWATLAFPMRIGSRHILFISLPHFSRIANTRPYGQPKDLRITSARVCRLSCTGKIFFKSRSIILYPKALVKRVCHSNSLFSKNFSGKPRKIQNRPVQMLFYDCYFTSSMIK